MLTKSGMMLGLGEAHEEVVQALEDLRAARVDLLTLGQYLQPTLKHLPVAEFIPPARFDDYRRLAEALGFSHVASGPLVRSSYHADQVPMTATATGTAPARVAHEDGLARG